ncbi:hypothetical protein VYU27_003797 [Nannochloropsis oceanica]
MEILSTNDGLLTDLDAYQLIKERMSKRAAEKKEKGKKAEKGAGGRSQKALTKNRDWIEKEIIRQLSELPAGGETEEGVKSFLTALQEFTVSCPPSIPPPSSVPPFTSIPTTITTTTSPSPIFTLAETLQLINLRPVAPVEVHLIIEECVERLSDEEVERLCELVAIHLGGGQGEEAGEGEEEGGGVS